MDINLYDLVKFLHVVCAVLWIGSLTGFAILGIRADKAGDNAEFGRIIGYVLFFAARVFTPASILLVLLGITMSAMVWGFAPLWILIGLAGFAATFTTGFFVLRPRAEKLAALMAKEGASAAVVAQGREFLTIGKFDVVMLFVVIADMVFKPGLGDWLLLLIMVVVLTAAAWLFLVPVFRASAPAKVKAA